MADKVNLEIAGVVENMAGFVTPGGERFAIFGEGGGQELADELDVPLLGKVPLTMPLREQADAGVPLVVTDPDDPAAQAIRQAARGLIAMFPLELPILQMATVGGSARRPGARAAGRDVPADGRLSGREGPLHGRGDRHSAGVTPGHEPVLRRRPRRPAPRPVRARRGGVGGTNARAAVRGRLRPPASRASPRDRRSRREKLEADDASIAVEGQLGPGEDRASRSRSRSS